MHEQQQVSESVTLTLHYWLLINIVSWCRSQRSQMRHQSRTARTGMARKAPRRQGSQGR